MSDGMKKTLFVVFVIYFMQGVIHNVGHPITPDFVTALGIPNYMFGTFFSLMALGLALGGIFWGVLGDSFSKKKLIVIGLLIYSLGQVLFGLIHNVYIMSLVRFVSGFGVSASITLLMVYLVESTPVKYRKMAIAYGTGFMTLGASVGYLIGGILPSLLAETVVNQAQGIFVLQGLVNVLYAVILYLLLDESVVSDKHIETVIDHIKSLRVLPRELILFLVSITLISVAAINISKFIEVYISYLGYGSKGIGDFVFVTGIVSIVATFFIAPFLTKIRFNGLAMIGMNLLSALIIGLTFRMGDVMGALYTLFMVYIIIKALYVPLEVDFIVSYAKDGQYGKVMGIRQFFFSIGYVIGPLIAGVLYDVEPLLVFDFSVLMFVLGAILLAIILYSIRREKLKF